MQMDNIRNNIKNILQFYAYSMTQLGDVVMSSKTIKIESKSVVKKPTKNLSTQPVLSQKIKEKPVETKPAKIIEKPQIKNIFDLTSITSIDELKTFVQNNNICEIQQFATNIVFGDGNPQAKILIIGEAPGQEEDEHGIPFCGRSGELLMNAFASIGLVRAKNFYVTNNIFWRPPGNRKPTDEELALCRPFLLKIIDIIKPEVIICVGTIAAHNILETQETISNLRQKIFTKKFGNLDIETKIYCIYHPSYLLRNPSKKYDMYIDLLYLLPNISSLL